MADELFEQKIPTNLLYNLINLFKFKNYPIELKGSGSYRNQLYPSDIDLFTSINKKYSIDEIYNEFIGILERTDTNNLYFIEFKLQRLDGTKLKFYKMEDITRDKFKEFFKNMDFAKIDYVVRFLGIFTELSIIYSFNTTKKNEAQSLRQDIEELLKEKQYYKVLKRKLSLMKDKPNPSYSLKKDMKEIINFFNSETGKKYAEMNNLKALELLLNNYNDEVTKQLVLDNLKILKIKPDLKKIKANISKLEDEVNNNALILLD
jgi:hypothetical protein